MSPEAIRKHTNCQFEIRHKRWATGQLVPGLFCRDHNSLLDWLRPHQSVKLIKELKLPVVDWYPTSRQQNRIKRKQGTKNEHTNLR